MRKLPPAIVIAVALIAVHMLASISLAGDSWRTFPAWYWALGAGLSYTVLPLFVVGMLELRQRGAAVGFAAVVVLGAVQVLVLDDSELLMKPAVRHAMNAGFLAGHLVAMGFLARAVWMRRPILALAAIACAVLVSPPEPLAKLIYSAFAPAAENFNLVQVAMRLPQLIVMVLLSIDLACESEPRPVVVADGFRHASRALCVFSAIAALAGIEALGHRFLLIAFMAGSLAWCAYGFLRAARAPMQRWFVTAAGTAVLWCMSLQVSSLPHGPGHHDMVTMIFMLVCAAGFVTRATASVVDKMHLQAKGFGAGMMFVTALAIQMFLVPQSQSERSMIALDVLTGFAIALGAWMLSWLCKLAAQRLESSDTTLPAARVV
jgi:hypothetical protein